MSASGGERLCGLGGGPPLLSRKWHGSGMEVSRKCLGGGPPLLSIASGAMYSAVPIRQ